MNPKINIKDNPETTLSPILGTYISIELKGAPAQIRHIRNALKELWLAGIFINYTLGNTNINLRPQEFIKIYKES